MDSSPPSPKKHTWPRFRMLSRLLSRRAPPTSPSSTARDDAATKPNLAKNGSSENAVGKFGKAEVAGRAADAGSETRERLNMMDGGSESYERALTVDGEMMQIKPEGKTHGSDDLRSKHEDKAWLDRAGVEQSKFEEHSGSGPDEQVNKAGRGTDTMQVVDAGAAQSDLDGKTTLDKEKRRRSIEGGKRVMIVEEDAPQSIKLEHKSLIKVMSFSRRKSELVTPAPQVVPMLESKDDEEFAVMSLNVLADHNLVNSVANPDDMRYKHAVDQVEWPARFKRLMEMLLEKHCKNLDVITMQEVDFKRFHEDFKPAMEKFGLIGIHQHDENIKKNGDQPPHPWGLATFYKKDRWRVSFKESRSRTMILGLTKLYQHGEGDGNVERSNFISIPGTKKKKMADWFVVNVHLEAQTTKTAARLGQLSSALFNLSTHTKIDPATARVVVLGDFNSDRNDAPVQWLISNTLPNTAAATINDEKGNHHGQAADGAVSEEEVKERENEKLVHAFKFKEAYDGGEVAEAPTYADPFGAWRVDHVVYTSETSILVRLLDVPRLNDENKQFGIFGVENFPTDHYPIGLVLRARTDVAANAAEPEADPDACPLSEGQLRVLDFLERGAPPKRKAHGKPSPAELKAIRDHAERVNAFTSHLDKAQKAWVTKYRKKGPPQYKEDGNDKTTPLLRRRSVAATLRKVSQQFFVAEGKDVGGGGARPGLLASVSAHFPHRAGSSSSGKEPASSPKNEDPAQASMEARTAATTDAKRRKSMFV